MVLNLKAILSSFGEQEECVRIWLIWQKRAVHDARKVSGSKDQLGRMDSLNTVTCKYTHR